MQQFVDCNINHLISNKLKCNNLYFLKQPRNLLCLADLILQERPQEDLITVISRPSWYREEREERRSTAESPMESIFRISSTDSKVRTTVCSKINEN